MYFVKTPWFIKKWFNTYVWDIKTNEKIIYLTFDDGPHLIATPFVLKMLKQYNATATFFCIGKNVQQHQDIYNSILNECHIVGNHTQNHKNGWQTKDNDYIYDISIAATLIDSKLYRPPYGKITKFQADLLQKIGFKIVMWDVLSGDFDSNISSKNCLNNVLLNAKSGSIIVFHDSQKAFEKLEFVLPKVLDFFSKKGYVFKSIS